MSTDIDWIKLHFSWANSERVALMSCLGELALLRLIMACARSGSVPADPAACLLLIGKRDMKKAAIVEALKEFTPHPTMPDRLVHARTMRDREAIIAKVEAIKQRKSEAGKRGADARWKPVSEGGTSPTDAKQDDGTSHASVMPLPKQEMAGKEGNGVDRSGMDRIGMERSGMEWSITNSLSAGGVSASAAVSISPDNSDWLIREMAALPAAWSPELRAKWSDWLVHLIEREHRRTPGKDIILCRPPTSTLDAHRRTLSPMPDDKTRIDSLETSIAARLGRPCDPAVKTTTTGGRAPTSTSSDHEKGF